MIAFHITLMGFLGCAENSLEVQDTISTESSSISKEQGGGAVCNRTGNSGEYHDKYSTQRIWSREIVRRLRLHIRAFRRRRD